MEKKFVSTNVDDINLNARHYVEKGRADGIRAIVKDNVAPGETLDDKAKWAAKAWDKCYDAVNKEDNPVASATEAPAIEDEHITIYPPSNGESDNQEED